MCWDWKIHVSSRCVFMLNYSYYVEVVIRAYIVYQNCVYGIFRWIRYFSIFLPLALRLAHNFLTYDTTQDYIHDLTQF